MAARSGTNKHGVPNSAYATLSMVANCLAAMSFGNILFLFLIEVLGGELKSYLETQHTSSFLKSRF